MLRFFALAAFLSFAIFARGDNEHFETLKVGTETYTNVTVTSVSATEIYFTHSRGIGNAKLKNLAPDLQKLFHFDSTKATAQEADQAKANALYRQELRNAPPPKRRLPAPEPPPETAPHETPPATQQNPIKAKSFLNQTAPILQVEKWLTDQPDTNGKFVLLDFWATWCGPCRASIPELNNLQARFKDRLVVIGLSDEPEQQVRRMNNPRIDYSIAIDTHHRTKSEVQVRAIPHTVLIDPGGIVRFEGHPGYLNERKLEALLTQFAR